jgi:UrcA family protein
VYNKLILAGVMVLLSAAAFAQDVQKKTLQFSDLNLSQPAGIEALYRRIRAASEAVCEDHEGIERNLKRFFDIRQCMSQAMRQAILKVGNTALTAYSEHVHPVKVAVIE